MSKRKTKRQATDSPARPRTTGYANSPGHRDAGIDHPTPSDHSGGHFFWWLAGLALLSVFFYREIARLSERFQFAAEFKQRPLIPVLLLFTILFFIYLFAISIARCAPQDRRLVGLLLGTSLLFRLMLVATTPIQEIDIYRYVWDGAVLAEGVNPFRYAPDQILYARSDDDLPNDLAELVELRDRSPSLRIVLERLNNHFGYLPTIYPPTSQIVFGLSSKFLADSASIRSRLTAMKIAFVAFDMGTICFLIALLKITRRPLGLSIMYGWCPLVMKEFANSGHLDAVAVFLTTAGMYLVARLIANCQGTSDSSHGEYLASNESASRRLPAKTDSMPNLFAFYAPPIVLALAIGAKLYTIVLAPIVFFVYARHFGWLRAARMAAVAALATLLVMWPMRPWAEPAAVAVSTTSVEASEHQRIEIVTGSANRTAGLKTFLKQWEINDFLFLIVFENLRPAAQPNTWFSFLPTSVRARSSETAFLVTRGISLLVFSVLAFYWAWRVYLDRHDSTNQYRWLEFSFLTLAWFWLLCPTQNPWYWIWALSLLPFARGQTWRLMAGLVMAYYLRFWFLYQYKETAIAGTPYQGIAFFDLVVTWFEYVPWYLALFAESVWRRRFLLSKKR